MENNCKETWEACDAIPAFDSLYTTNHMKILKMLFPYVDYKYRNKLAFYIKWQEFLLTFYFMNPSALSPLKSPDISMVQNDPTLLLSRLIPYCSEEEKKLLGQLQEAFGILKNFNNIKEYLPMIQGLMSQNKGGEINLTELMGSMLSEEQKEMFSMFMET